MTTLFISHSSKDKDWAERMHQALEDGGYECLFLDSHPDDGIHVGADWERTLYQRLRQSRGVVVLCSAHWIASTWCVAEVILARERGKRIFLVAAGEPPPRIPDFLKDSQFASLGSMTEREALERLLQGLEKEGLKNQDFHLPDRPYPGLEPFQETDAAVYFGRHREVDEVIDVLGRRRRHNAHGFVLILGASGCGKSSLARAGVLPRLRRSSGEGGAPAAWVIPPPLMTGKGPNGLALSLAQAFKDAGRTREVAAVRRGLDTAGGLGTLAKELLLAGDAPDGCVLLVLDQLEEVFGTPEKSAARRMLRLLLEASAETAGPLVVLATMRSDYLNAFQLFEGTAERYEKVTLDPMPRSRFAEVIVGPADRFGIDVDPGLAGRMTEETAYNDALPLLAFTLEKLFAACRAQGRLTVQAYEELGGVSTAIRHAADAVLEQTGYNGLPENDPRMRDLRHSFYSMAQVGEEGQFTRRTARWSRMPASCKAILNRFVVDRLLVSGADDRDEPTLTVAHEALFRVWHTLNGWLHQDRKALALRSQIVDAATEWQREDRADSRAWPEERILDAVQEIQQSGVSLADVDEEHRATVDAFFGPTDYERLVTLPGLGASEDATAGSGPYGDPWHLPLSHEARASVGVRLALLGDRREGVGLRDDGLPAIAWHPVEGGEVTIEVRTDPNDPNSRVDKRLTRPVASFRMARSPVTIAQFRAFLDACHGEDGWHLPPGCPIDLPAGYPPPKHRARHGNHPADTVNWYDAMAFCHWLSLGLGFEVRLPTEFEWQQAATGGAPDRVYPWSDPSNPEWDPQQEPWRANTTESDLGRSTAVGMYPSGASAGGILDMAGTLWEWCQNAFDDPTNFAFPGSPREYRVLRGGSWYNDRDGARSADRIRNAASDRDGSIGFRVVCSSPSSGL